MADDQVWKAEVETLYDDFRERAGQDTTVAAMLVVACKIGGLQYELRRIYELLNQQKKAPDKAPD